MIAVGAAPVTARTHSMAMAAQVQSAVAVVPNGRCAVLLHGLGRTHRSMDKIAAALRGVGYGVVSVAYPSRSQPIEVLAMQAVPEGLAWCRARGLPRVDVVTHSMGGIVLRYYLSGNRVAELGRVVMLSPPNQGSEVADVLQGIGIYAQVNGPAGGQLGTGPEGIAARLGPVDFDLGVITGNQQTTADSFLATHFTGPNDGKVSVERAQVDGMRDFLVLPATHTFIVSDPTAVAQVLYFLEHGRFDRPIQPGPVGPSAAAE